MDLNPNLYKVSGNLIRKALNMKSCQEKLAYGTLYVKVEYS